MLRDVGVRKPNRPRSEHLAYVGRIRRHWTNGRASAPDSSGARQDKHRRDSPRASTRNHRGEPHARILRRGRAKTSLTSRAGALITD
jgi:hypothetical protein